MARCYDTALALAASVAPVDPPARVRERLLSAIRQPSNYTLTASDAWGDYIIPGISAKILAVDTTRGLVTLLLRGEAGAAFPAHHHSTSEECYVVRGSIAIGNLVLHAGDFHHADADSDHGEIVALESTEVLLFAGIDDYLPA